MLDTYDGLPYAFSPCHPKPDETGQGAAHSRRGGRTGCARGAICTSSALCRSQSCDARTTCVTWSFVWAAAVSLTSGTACIGTESPITVGASCGASECVPCRRCHARHATGFSFPTSECLPRGCSSQAMRRRSGNRTLMRAPSNSLSHPSASAYRFRKSTCRRTSRHERVFTLRRVSAVYLAPVGRDIHPLPCVFMRVSTATFMTYGVRLRMLCISERYRTLAHCVCDPRHACITESMRERGSSRAPFQ